MDKIKVDVLAVVNANFWLIRIFILLFAGLVITSTIYAIYRRLNPKLLQTKRIWDDALLEATYLPLMGWTWVVVLLLVARIVMIQRQLWPQLINYYGTIYHITFIIFLFWFAMRFTNEFEKKHVSRAITEQRDQTTIRAIGQVMRVIIITIALLTTMKSFGISIAALLAAGGIGGIAIGFAAKDTIANFIGGMMIYWDRPFAVGDWVRSPDRNIEGVVEHIGWRLTRIRTFDKRPLYVPNGAFSTISVENPSRMSNRRIRTTIGVRYKDAPKMAAILSDVEKMLIEHPEIDTQQTLMVNLIEFGPSSLNFLVYTFTKTTNWVKFQAIQQEIFLKIIDIIDQHGAECAFPTMTLDVPDPLIMQNA